MLQVVLTASWPLESWLLPCRVRCHDVHTIRTRTSVVVHSKTENSNSKKLLQCTCWYIKTERLGIIHLNAKKTSKKMSDHSSPVSCFMCESHSKHQTVVLTNTSRIGEAAHSTRSRKTCWKFSINRVFLKHSNFLFFINIEGRLVLLEQCPAD